MERDWAPLVLDSRAVGDYGAAELAEAAGITVALLRSYQSKGLLPAPRREGRAAYYGARHLERLREIAELKRRGYSLRSIAEHYDPPATAELAPPEVLRLRDVATRSGVPIEMLRSWQASGLIRPRRPSAGEGGPDGGPAYDHGDVAAARAILLLVGSGIPFDEFLDVARVQLDAGAELAKGAIGLFEEHVEPRLDPEDTAVRERALAEMADAIGRLAAYVVVRQLQA